MHSAPRNLDDLCINTIRLLAVDAVERAKSGHPGLPLGAAPMAYALWQNHLRHNPNAPTWADRDRFVLSAGHGSMLLYALLHLTGYDVSLGEIQNFRQWGSRTPGHPETFATPGVEATTGPLGQGSANAVGMAVAERFLAQLFNRPGHTIVDHFTYALVSDGDLMEGLSAEASSLAGHLKLGKLIYLYDANQISLDGPTSLAFSEDVGKRYEAYGWQVLRVEHGDTDIAAINRALDAAKAHTVQPSLIIVKTTIGFGSPNKQGTAAAHGSPLGADEVARTKAALGWDPKQSFVVPESVQTHLHAGHRGETQQAQWEARFAAYAAAHPQLAQAWHKAHEGPSTGDWEDALPTFAAGEALATREACGKVINALAAKIPHLLGGDADLSTSTLSNIKASEAFDGQGGTGRNIHYGVREHAMAALANGMAYHRGVHPFVATFFVFSDYMRPSVRLAALSKLPVTYVWTHDSIGLGEDGPTHQPVEHLAALRAMPNLTIIRPADANETAGAWRVALTHRQGPVGLVLSRQKLPVLGGGQLNGQPMDVGRGAYVLADPPGGGTPQAIIIATGSEVHIALAARELLQESGFGVRVVSMPSWELYARQDAAYRQRVLPAAVTTRLAIEAGVSLGWERWVGAQGHVLGLDRFGYSAPAAVLYEKFNFTAGHAADCVRKLLAQA